MTHPRAVAVVQARMGSTRLPGKSLLPLAGRALIFHVVDWLRRTEGLDDVVVATTSEPNDDPLAAALEMEGVAVYRHPGASGDLLGRFIGAGRRHRADIVLHVCGDCPLFAPETAARMIARLRDEPEAEYVAIDPALEGGVACLRLSTYERLDREGATGPYREHATLRIIEQPEEFRITKITAHPAYVGRPQRRLWLDTPADHAFLSAIFDRLYAADRPIRLEDVLDLLDREPALSALNQHVEQKDPHFTSPIVGVAAGRDEDERALLSALSRELIERHHVGVQPLDRALAGSTSRPRALVLVEGMVMEAPPEGVPVLVVSRDEPLDRAAERIRAAVARPGAAGS